MTGATGAAAAAGANAVQTGALASGGGVGTGLGDTGSGVSPNAIQIKAPNPNFQIGPDGSVPRFVPSISWSESMLRA